MTASGPEQHSRTSTTGDASRLARHAWNLLVRPTGEPAPAPPRLTLLTVLGIFGMLLAWRAAIFIAGIAWGRLGIDHPWPGDETYHILFRYSLRWDTGWYLSVIREGYFYDPDGQSSIAFFPLFPYATRLVDWILPGNDILAGMLVVHVALVAALIYVYQLGRIDYPESVAWRGLFFLLIFPSAIFLSAFYTESLLLLGFAGTLYHARRGQWLLAGIFGFFTGLTKLIGLILILPVGLELLRQRAVSFRSPGPILASALVPLGGLGYLGYLHLWLGDFRTYFQSQEHWARESFNPEPFIMFVKYLAGQPTGHFPYPGEIIEIHDMFFMLDVGSALLFLAAGVYLWVRVLPSYGALVIAGALVPALSGTPLALARYMVILFPVFILLGSIKSEPVRTAIAIVFVMGLGFEAYLFINGYWAG